MSDPQVPPEVADKLRYYVYLYSDPRTGEPFYVGKGHRKKLLAHLAADGDSQKSKIIHDLRAAGLEPRIEVLAHGLRDEETALRIEAAAIDLLGLGNLTNEVRGWRTVQFGRMTLSELHSYYAAEPVEISHPTLLIRINKRYRHSMSAEDLYEATRGVWRVGPRREDAHYAMAVFEGIVKDVYVIMSWHKAGSTNYKTRSDVDSPNRWEFIGEPAEDKIRSAYLNRKVSSYFRQGNASPTLYVNC